MGESRYPLPPYSNDDERTRTGLGPEWQNQDNGKVRRWVCRVVIDKAGVRDDKVADR